MLAGIRTLPSAFAVDCHSSGKPGQESGHAIPARRQVSLLPACGFMWCIIIFRTFFVCSYLAGSNKNVKTGGYFSINLLERPFLMPKPLEVRSRWRSRKCGTRKTLLDLFTPAAS